MTTPADSRDFDAGPYLRWEYSTDPGIQYLNCAAPEPLRNHLPEWFRSLRGNIREYLPEGFGQDHTIRHCLGFRGMLDLGWTIPLPETLVTGDTYFSRGHLHPEMLHGTRFAETRPEGHWLPGDSSPYRWAVRLQFWPWRARMPQGWRLVILPYQLDWQDWWQEFSGSVEPNYHVVNGTGIGSGLRWTQPIDPVYNYYNIETVMAFQRDRTVPAGTLTFMALPYFDPVLYTQQTGQTP